MLGKMIIHGVVAIAVVGSAAAVYAQAKDNGYLSPASVEARRDPPPVAKTDDGYIRPAQGEFRRHEDERRYATKSDRHRDRHDRKRDHDDDDD